LETQSHYNKHTVVEMVILYRKHVLCLLPYHWQRVWAQTTERVLGIRQQIFQAKGCQKLLEEEIKWVTAGKRANCVQHLAEEEKACFWDTDSMETPSSSIQHQQVILFKDVRLNSNTVPALYITFIFCPS
jgi:hypothetical protein